MDSITITITKDQLKNALASWEQDYRDGKTQTPEEVAAKPVEQVASESVEHLWVSLGG